MEQFFFIHHFFPSRDIPDVRSGKWKKNFVFLCLFIHSGHGKHLFFFLSRTICAVLQYNIVKLYKIFIQYCLWPYNARDISSQWEASVSVLSYLPAPEHMIPYARYFLFLTILSESIWSYGSILIIHSSMRGKSQVLIYMSNMQVWDICWCWNVFLCCSQIWGK